MKSSALLVKTKMINSSKCLYDSKHQKTPNKQQIKTNTNGSYQSNVDFLNLSKSIKHAQRKEGSMKTTAQSTARKYQLEKNQKHQNAISGTITSPFSPKDSLFESKILKKISLQESNLDSMKVYPNKNESSCLDSSKNIKSSETNYNKIMQKIDKKQKLLNELKKLSGQIRMQTIKTFTQAQKYGKKDFNCHKKQEELLSGSHISKNSKQSSTDNLSKFNKISLENHNKCTNSNSSSQIGQKISLKQTEKAEKNSFKKQDDTIKKCKSSQFIPKNQKQGQRQTTKTKAEDDKNKNKNLLLVKNSHDHPIKPTNEFLLKKSVILSPKMADDHKLNINDHGQHVAPEHKFFKQKHSIKDFQVQKSLGEGKFGIVYQVIHKETKTIYALKKLSKQIIKQNGLVRQFIQQIKIQSYCDHENILQLYGFFHDKDYFYLILQYMEEGTLFNQLKKSELEAAVKLKHLAEGVKYLHNQGIAHRDIKPENIVMSHGVGKLCDFGWAAICTERRKTYCGTFDYVAPQILQGEQYDISVDLWCLGVLAYQLLVGKAPFYHVSRTQTMKKILNIESTSLDFPSHLSKISISFIERLIKKNPQQRMTAQAILKHPFLVQVKQKSI